MRKVMPYNDLTLLTPSNFICNTTTEHVPEGTTVNLHTPTLWSLGKKLWVPCACVACLKLQTGKAFHVGAPVQVHEGFNVDWLKAHGFVGLYLATENVLDPDMSAPEI